MIQGDGEKHEIWLKGTLMSLESSTEIPYGNTIHCLEIVQREKDKINEDELDALRTSFNHMNARNHLMPCQKTLENIGKENKSMTVKIKKQPREITLEELKQAEEFEKVTLYIDKNKQNEIEERYGVSYILLPCMEFERADFDFREHYVAIEDGILKKIPYDFIEKIEVVEK